MMKPAKLKRGAEELSECFLLSCAFSGDKELLWICILQGDSFYLE